MRNKKQEIKNQKSKIFVLYHQNCSSGDGFGAAWAARKKFGRRAEYIAIDHDQKAIPRFCGATIYLLDITLSRRAMEQLLFMAQRVVALDHHESAEKETKMAHEYIYDLARSGATIAWHYFFSNKRVPWLLRYLEDGDNWKFRLPHTKEMLASIHAHERTFTVWDRLVQEFETTHGRRRHCESGEAVLAYEKQLVQKAVENAYLVNFCGYRVYAVNSSVMRDYIGHALAKKTQSHFGVVWRRSKDIVAISLRSKGSRDVSVFAKKFGGGGHKHAAAFVIPANKSFPWKEIKTKK
ncbi:MAG TPA: DHHA1 domain-containing protein [Candidatus Paceibacterota bacterium]